MASSFRWFLRSKGVLMQAGEDYLILDDVSRYGLHRRHIVREGDLPDPSWVEVLQKKEKVQAWGYMDDQNIGHLWITWKDRTG